MQITATFTTYVLDDGRSIIVNTEERFHLARKLENANYGIQCLEEKRDGLYSQIKDCEETIAEHKTQRDEILNSLLNNP